MALRKLLPKARIAVLHGVEATAARAFVEERLIPVLNHLGQIALWRKAGRGEPAMLHVDTGMSRLGLPPSEAARLARDPSLLHRVTLAGLMSHLSTAWNISARVNLNAA